MKTINLKYQGKNMPKQASFKPPEEMIHVDYQDKPLDVEDPRYVPTYEGRGEYSVNKFYKRLGMGSQDLKVVNPPEMSYWVFCGHRGCGKSTELRRIARDLYQEGRFFVTFLDVVLELDPNNLAYPDVLMALAGNLLQGLKKADIKIKPVHYQNLENWFKEKIIKNEKTQSFKADIQSQVKGETGIPFLAKISATLTAAFHRNHTYKEELRQVIKSYYSQFSEALNDLIREANKQVKEKGYLGKLLFIIDGTDQLNQDQSHAFFIQEVPQLQAIESNFIYCAPIHLLYEGNQVQQAFKHFILPMIKLNEKGKEEPWEKGYEVMREALFRRASEKLFDKEETVNYLIRYSGGCLRELLKLLEYTYAETETEQYTLEAAKKAVRNLSLEYDRWLEPEDFKTLYKKDHSPNEEVDPERKRRLLYNIALMEYNNYWQQSHPVIRELEAYQRWEKYPSKEE